MNTPEPEWVDDRTYVVPDHDAEQEEPRRGVHLNYTPPMNRAGRRRMARAQAKAQRRR